MDDHRKLYRRIFSFERFIRNLTRSFSTMSRLVYRVGGTRRRCGRGHGRRCRCSCGSSSRARGAERRVRQRRDVRK
uniref:Uncharacterized protein n=1 Tax=Globodera pallida TaxID=36090 RepID=A0A183CRX3_GLOPA